MPSAVNVSPEVLESFCRRHHIRKPSVFGSALRSDFNPESDIDVLVEFEPGRTPGFAFFRVQEELLELFGRKADLNTPAFLSRYFRQDVLRNAQIQYEA